MCQALQSTAINQAAAVAPIRMPSLGSKNPLQPSSSPRAPVMNWKMAIIKIAPDGISGAPSPAARPLHTAIAVISGGSTMPMNTQRPDPRPTRSRPSSSFTPAMPVDNKAMVSAIRVGAQTVGSNHASRIANPPCSAAGRRTRQRMHVTAYTPAKNATVDFISMYRAGQGRRRRPGAAGSTTFRTSTKTRPRKRGSQAWLCARDGRLHQLLAPRCQVMDQHA
jgi:hypothetical protein